MARILSGVGGLAAACATAASVSLAGAPATQSAAARTIYVNVVDQDERPVRDLTAAEFMVREDNVIREIADVKPATEPLVIAVLVDTTPDAEYAVKELRAAVLSFVRTVLTASPASQISIGEFGGASMAHVKFTSDLDDLERVIPRIYPKRDVQPVLSEAIVEASRDLARHRALRRVIVTINMEPSVEASHLQPKHVADEVRRSGASLWAVSIQKGPDRNLARDALLTSLAKYSGGLRTTVVSPAGLETMLKAIADHLLSAYAIEIKRPERAAAARQTQVLVNREGARALTLLWSQR